MFTICFVQAHRNYHIHCFLLYLLPDWISEKEIHLCRMACVTGNTEKEQTSQEDPKALYACVP